MSRSFVTVTLVSLLAGAGLAAPHIELNTRDKWVPCPSRQEYKDVVVSAPYYGDWVLANAIECTSGDQNNCEIVNGYSHTVTVEKSVSGSFTGGLDLGKIASAGFDAGFSYGWSTSDETAIGTTQICPTGGITCSAAAHPRLVKTTGKVRTQQYGRSDCTLGTDWSDFTVVAPSMVKIDDKTSKPEVGFDICMKTCYNTSGNFPDSCPDVQSGKIKIAYCPNYPPAGHYPWGNL
ncbi:hypothetical protein JX265_003741 [Neoarthrinium moseri]|uniref:Uncharacterized protein n=1 Tax=Neoarthrinium moseri TaxID=1658444 RepID=A0A9P9WSM8_9PEZI|nr:uncharacterized protein JN550_002485 [Neoarthrinium moseri]KAI1843845.1 hypothetical protein JX266_009901 [Neoarthrinium moseri]KAI1875056.1 hypothetical protein JN550_002485 [Neoarthrinium moseri]KAI1877733.1 hypothetical protein JX265_003741 [Neoarthrinium moseri]